MPEETPSVDDDSWCHTIPKVVDFLVKLELAKGTPKPEPKKRGRKPGSKNQKKAEDSDVTSFEVLIDFSRVEKNSIKDKEVTMICHVCDDLGRKIDFTTDYSYMYSDGEMTEYYE